MRTLAAVLLLFAAGCGRGPVTEDEFRGFMGKNVSEVTGRMGQPDKQHSGDGMMWYDKVKKKDGKAWKRAYISFSLDRMLVTSADVDDE